MTRFVHLLTLLAVIAVPVIGWFVDGWSGATTLLVYWFENVAASLFITARGLIHQRWTPRRGHFKYESPSENRRRSQRSSFMSGFVVTSLAFSVAHGVFLAVIIFLLDRTGERQLAEVNWRSVELGCAIVLVFVVVDFLVDLLSLRRWSFRQLEQTAYLGLGRIVVVQLTLMIGFVGIAMTDAPTALFGTFVVLKTLFALSSGLPQWEPVAAPQWLSRVIPADQWAKDRVEESARRDRNEQSWDVGRR